MEWSLSPQVFWDLSGVWQVDCVLVHHDCKQAASLLFTSHRSHGLETGCLPTLGTACKYRICSPSSCSYKNGKWSDDNLIPFNDSNSSVLTTERVVLGPHTTTERASKAVGDMEPSSSVPQLNHGLEMLKVQNLKLSINSAETLGFQSTLWQTLQQMPQSPQLAYARQVVNLLPLVLC